MLLSVVSRTLVGEAVFSGSTLVRLVRIAMNGTATAAAFPMRSRWILIDAVFHITLKPGLL